MRIVAKEPSDSLLSQFVHPNMKAMPGYHIDIAQARIKLDQNEMSDDWPGDLKQEVIDRIKSVAWNRYPSPFAPQVSALLAEYAGVDVDCIITGPGTNHLITMIMSAFAAQMSGKFVIAQPSFPLYESHARAHGYPVEVWPLNSELEYDFRLLPKVAPGSVIVFASPNNPVGNVLSRAQLNELCGSHPSSLVLADEAYFEFADEQYTDLLNKHDNLIILRTCSKTMGAAGLRLGYGIASKSLISQLMKPRLPYLLSSFSIAAAMELLPSNRLAKLLPPRIAALKEQRQFMFDALQELSKKRSFKVHASQANFLLVRWQTQEQCQLSYQRLLNEFGILVRNVSKGPGLQGCLRISVGNEAENRAFLAAAQQCF